jgi:predicted nuclease with TOPRIM domain
MIEKYKALEAENERLKGINSALCTKSNSCLIQNARLEEERDELKRQLAEYKALLSNLMEVVEEPPERNCSCHTSPPCSDCVEWSGLREALLEARTAMKEPQND